MKFVTHKQPGTIIGPPWTRGRYETLDYVAIGDRWKNCIKDCESDVFSNLTTDHIIINFIVKITLRGIQQANRIRPKIRSM